MEDLYDIDLQRLFSKFLDGHDDLKIETCAVCGDITCYPENTVSIESCGWEKLSSGKYVCEHCLNTGYITTDVANSIDKINEINFGSKYISEDSNRLIRNQLTWDEANKERIKYKNELKKYLLNNNIKTYNDNIKYFE